MTSSWRSSTRSRRPPGSPSGPPTQNQLHVVLSEADAITVAALEAFLQNDFEAAVFSYRWHAAPLAG